MSQWSRADVHATWVGREVCLWAWANGPASTAPLNALYLDLYGGRPSGRVGNLAIAVPGRGSVSVPCVFWPAHAAVEAMIGRPCSPSWSASLAWVHRVVEAGAAMVATRHVVPDLGADPAGSPVADRAHLPFWRVVRDGNVDAVLERLVLDMPPVVAAAGPVDVADVLQIATDAAARTVLRHARWKPVLPTGREAAGRAPSVRLVRALFRQLAGESAESLVAGVAGTAGSDDPVIAAHRWLRSERARLLGERVLRVRLRMVPPADPDGFWDFTLEVVDTADSRCWCTADELLSGAPGAERLSGSVRDQQHAEATLLGAAQSLAQAIPQLALLGVDPAQVAHLEVDDVAVVLGLAERLEPIGVDLIGPEQLVRASVRVSGQATPIPEGGIDAGLGSRALVQWSARIDSHEIDADELARAQEAGSVLMQVAGRWVRLEQAEVRRVLDALDRHRTQHSEVAAADLLRLAAQHEGEGAAPEVDGSGWARELLAGLPDDQLAEAHEHAAFVGELRHYQRRGLAWLQFHARLGFGAVLADDMGLGKTATTIAHLMERPGAAAPGPHLVVCPLSVVRNWQNEIARFAPSLSVCVHHGDDRAQGDSAAVALSEHSVVITTYGLLAREIDVLAGVQWSTVVLDEAQAVKNPNTKAARAVRRLSAGQRVALTGTPIENRLSELWAILDAVNPGLLGSLARFQERYASPIERQRSSDAAERLRRLTGPFVLRRTKADKQLLPDLPDKVEQIAWASLTREQAAMYQSVVDELLRDAESATGMRRRGLVLASLTRLKQICNHPAQALGDGSRLAGRSGKLARFEELVAELLDAGERALVFTQYREMGLLLQRALATERPDRMSLDVPFLHGGVPRARRDAMVARFQEGVGAPLLLVSLKAGGTGLNLTSASRVIHYDRWWNPAVEDQATDRAWRIGQTQTVFVHKLVCSGTLEERIGKLIDDKRALASTVIGATGEAWLSELSTDQLRDLVVLAPAGESS